MPDLRKEIEQGDRAKRILQDPLFIDAWNQMEKGLIEHFKATSIKDVDIREHIHISLGILERLKKTFEETLTTGKLAAKQIEKITR